MQHDEWGEEGKMTQNKLVNERVEDGKRREETKTEKKRPFSNYVCHKEGKKRVKIGIGLLRGQ